jgi:CHRD domain
MTRRRLQLAAAVVFVLGLAVASIALASGGDKGHGKHSKGNFRAKLVGFQEVPAVNTTGHARLRLSLTDTEITFQLEYADLSGNPAVAHIHVGQRGVNGGVAVFFCGGGGKPACPASTSGSVSGTITAENLVGPAAQGYPPAPAGKLADLEKAIRSGVAYANMHTANFPAGEIRGQIKPGHGKGH